MDPIVKNLDRPDQRPELPKGHAEFVHMGDFTVVRGVLEPGWRWSNDWRPIFNTPSCQVAHTGLVLAGRWHFEMDDGTGVDLGPGDVYSIPAGHDAWVVGDDPVQTLDWGPVANEPRNESIGAGTKQGAD